MEFERSDRSHQNSRRRTNPSRPALDVDELLSTQISTEARFGDDVIRHSKPCCGCNHAVTAVRDIGKRSTVHKCWRTLKGLNQVGRQGVFQNSCQCTFGLEVCGSNRGSITGIRHHDAAQSSLEIIKIGR